MSINKQTPVVAFQGPDRIADGPLGEVAIAVKKAVEQGRPVLVFHRETSQPVDLDLRGDVAFMLAQLPETDEDKPPAKRRPGRPKLGVKSREVTLLPRHWRWLSGQPGSASVTLRRLVERAMRGTAERKLKAQDTSYRFMLAMAGNEPGYEEALRALYRGDRDRFVEQIEGWPDDVRAHVRTLAGPAFDDPLE